MVACYWITASLSFRCGSWRCKARLCGVPCFHADFTMSWKTEHHSEPLIITWLIDDASALTVHAQRLRTNRCVQHQPAWELNQSSLCVLLTSLTHPPRLKLTNWPSWPIIFIKTMANKNNSTLRGSQVGKTHKQTSRLTPPFLSDNHITIWMAHRTNHTQSACMCDARAVNPALYLGQFNKSTYELQFHKLKNAIVPSSLSSELTDCTAPTSISFVLFS